MMTQKRTRDASRVYFGPRADRLDHVIDEMGEEKRQKQDRDADHPKEKMLGQFGGVNFLLVHEGEDTPHGRTGGSTRRAYATKGTIRLTEDLEVSIGKVSKEAGDAFFEHHHFVFYSRSQGGALK
jgi:hypothetical protein